MLRSIKQLYGNKLGASDGDLGHVKDFYFDDQNWAIRYLVVDTGSWLTGRQVLLAPYSLGRLDQAEKILRVNLTRKQIENSPSIESHKPVSRQYEEEYYRYFGWPYYWQGDGLWGLSGTPILDLPVMPLPSQPAVPVGPQSGRADAHLRSAHAVKGYHIQATDGIVGHVADFMMDAGSWAIGQLVVKTGHRLSGRDVLIPTKGVARISYADSAVFINMTKEAVEQSSVPELAPAGTVL